MPTVAASCDPFAVKRAAMREEFFGHLFLLGGWIGGTDTYKRTMWAAVPDIAVARAGYGLTMRKGLPEPGADNQLIMAGHEAMLAQWFHRPLRRTDIELARRWFSDHAATRAFPHALWDAILSSQPGEDIHLLVNIWGFPGGQTFLPGVPCLFFEGTGGAISYLEPAMCRYFAPIIQATKARLMKQITPRDAEFGELLRLADTAKEGEGAIATMRKTIGATNPADAEPGTIRGDFGLMVGRNLMDHPGTSVAFLAADPLWPGRGPQRGATILDLRDGYGWAASLKDLVNTNLIPFLLVLLTRWRTFNF